ncbi:unnamed protein product [Mycena citricolor]|uniref:BTB domain-containing protein n=1 Tax=Mycena citricolor TaxID=2018698 RepID=A0AAD2HLD7_9AGAR|nr:unnamed protein product [Mycena citricolor]
MVMSSGSGGPKPLEKGDAPLDKSTTNGNSDETHALSLQEATRNSTALWQQDLATLFRNSKDRFPDVVWELKNVEGEVIKGIEEVWGHKAIVYARAPPSFQSRYFSFRPQDPHRDSPGLGTSVLSLDFRGSPSPFHNGTSSPAPSTTVGGITRLTTSINSALFSNELEYLYTGQGFGEAFEFLFDEQGGTAEGDEDGEEMRIDKLRKDLVFMWRSRLYSDVRIALVSNGSVATDQGGDRDEDDHDKQMPVFSSHRFILASRCPYFHTALLSWPGPQKPLTSSASNHEPLILNLPSPPFTPASLHFTLGFLYTGTLVFSHRTYDLTTALALLQSANYLSIPALYEEVRGRIVVEMAHGLFHAALPFPAYEAMTGGVWGGGGSRSRNALPSSTGGSVGGCTCRRCTLRIPRILTFALRNDVHDPILERGSRRALVGLFGLGWCTEEFGRLEGKIHAAALRGLAKRTSAESGNVLRILWAAEAARAKLTGVDNGLGKGGMKLGGSGRGAQKSDEDWVDIVRPLIEAARTQADKVMADQTALVFASGEWMEIVQNQGARFDDAERVELSMRSIVRGLRESNAGRVYQALVNVLLLPAEGNEEFPRDQNGFPAQPLLAQTSHVRVQVEQARMDVLAWLKRGGHGRADRVAREGGLDGVQGWAISEIADALDLRADDLTAAIPTSSTISVPNHARQTTASTSAAHARKSTGLLSARAQDREETRSLSIHTQQSSMRVSVLSKGISTPTARSVRKQESRDEEIGDRPDSKLTPQMGVMDLDRDSPSSSPSSPKVPLSPSPSPRPAAPTRSLPSSPSTTSLASSTTGPKYARSGISVNVSPAPRPRSSASTRSTATVRSTATTRGLTRGLHVPSATIRRTSTASTSSAAEFKTALSTAASSTRSRSRQNSVSSTSVRSRKTSGASDASVSATSPSRTTPGPTAAAKKRVGTPSIRSVAGASVRSTSTMDTATSAARRSATAKEKKPEVKVITLKHRPRAATGASTKSNKGKEKEEEKPEKPQPPSPPTSEMDVDMVSISNASGTSNISGTTDKDHRKTDSTASVSTLRAKRRDSAATISTATTKRPVTSLGAPAVRGAMLEIGIPCIISTKRRRFKAFARYIGEVQGESGPWVGVEVPASTAESLMSSQQWNDGSWGGVRYFEIGASGDDWEYGDRADEGRARRRKEGSTSTVGVKRSGDSTLSAGRSTKRIRSSSPSASDSEIGARGLFVRPSAVLYVVDAVGADL